LPLHVAQIITAIGWKLASLTSNIEPMTSIWELANPQLRDLGIYEPGKPIEETARELNVTGAVIKLASNENLAGRRQQSRPCAPHSKTCTCIPMVAGFCGTHSKPPTHAREHHSC
jgi:hypothetical protein